MLYHFCGVDPGQKGAAVVIGYKLPANQIVSFAFIDGDNSTDISTFFKAHPFYSGAIEQVGIRPRQRGQSEFVWRSGTTHGLMLAHAQNEVSMVRPQVWKKYFNLPACKDRAREKAAQRFGQWAGLFNRKKDDGRAEAALLAEYARHKALLCGDLT